MVLGSIASFVAVVAGMYRLGRLCFGPVVGLLAGLLVLSRFFVENLAAQGYLDISYVALIVWAVVLEVERPRRGHAGLPDARRRRPAAPGRMGAERRLLAVVLMARRTTATRLRYLALAAIAPVVWVARRRGRDRQPAVLAELHRRPRAGTRTHAGTVERGRARCGRTGCGSTSCPVILGGLVGVPLAIWLAPRRVLTPLAALVLLVGVFVAEGAVGASVIDRYLMGAAIVLLLFCAVTIGGWAMLEPGSTLRRVWMAGAAVLVLYGGASAATTLSLSSLRTTLAYHEDFHKGLAVALASPRVKARAAALSAAVAARQQADPGRPLDPRQRRTARHRRAQPGARRRRQGRARAGGSPARGSVAVYPLGSAVFVEAIVDVGDDPRDQDPAGGLQTHLHEPLLRGLCQLLRFPAAGPGRRSRSCSRAASACACGASSRGCPTPTTPTRPTTSCRARSRCSNSTASTRTTSPTRRRSPTCCTSCSRVAYGSASAVRARVRASPGRRLHARARRRRGARRRRAVAAVRDRRAPVRPRRRPARGGDRGGRVPARLLRAPGAQRRADARAADAVAARHAGVLRKGRARDYLLAGVGLGLACASKYTAGIVLVPLVAALARALPGGRAQAPARARRSAASRSPGRAALLAFLVANPYAVLDYHDFHAELVHQSTLSAEAQGKLGAPKQGGARLLPVVADLGPRLGAGAGGARRGA